MKVVLVLIGVLVSMGAVGQQEKSKKAQSDQIQVGRIGDYGNAEFRGKAAEAVYKVMTKAKEDSREEGSVLINIRIGNNMTCEETAEGKVRYLCYFGISKNGALSSARLRSAGPPIESGAGPITVGGINDYLNGKISGEPAKVLYNVMLGITPKEGTKRGENISCSAKPTSPKDKTLTYQCEFGLDKKGNVTADKLK